ncbi:M42 family metallopeptidase [Natronocalculus amylovorans]|uniref:M42 family metallopeptidase n=1 Tax=Natronocalculus amylovorans TaxID=2917812 RepID=A0AAE3FUG7_9EURY|nr:M42 family metallopeptidase [Natronocalculus amylovorans]MCL9815355.1 M42 family metallopeptidase [Natronocalculus amylovorans]NUE02130.1 M42 family metallopeptidase [Halorubraceae archaeon YAN]
MTMDFDFDLLVELTEACGVPGYEDDVRAIVQREFADAVDEVRTDAMGNVIGTIHGDSEYSVAIAAHMDEIGFMVRHVTDDGFVQLDPLGGFDARVLRAQRVTIHTDDGDLTGVIGSVPPHTLTEEQQSKKDEVKNVYVDIGRDGDAVSELVSVGDLATLEQTTVEMGDCVTGKALDDRVCLFSMLEAAKRIEDPAVTIHFAATVQEEVGLRGATALGVDIDPDLAIALDVTVANDVPIIGSEADAVTKLGEGTAIKLKDSSVITSPKVHKRLKTVAEDEQINYQLEVLPAGGTDTAGFQNTHGAKPVGAISIPTRYLHTVTETANCDDIAATIDLLSAFLATETGTHDYML